MLPHQLKPESFNAYAPLARALAGREVSLLGGLPLAFLPLLLREVIAYDWKFPAERDELDRQLAYLGSLHPDQRNAWMAPFAKLRLAPELENVDWVNAPAQFSEQLTAHLWATHQIDAFRAAAVEYVARLNEATPAPPLPLARLAMVVVGHAVPQTEYALFRKLRPHGVHFKQVEPANGLAILVDAVRGRASQHPVPFGHWHLDGGNVDTAVAQDGVTRVSYPSLEPVRSALLSMMETAMRAGGGPELLRSRLGRLRPEDLGIKSSGNDAVLDQFKIGLLTEGSGTQIFSTTFVQWAAREVLRRAQPVTLLARFAPRQHEQSMNEALRGSRQQPVLDPMGSLVDGDMGAYYTWINQQRLAGAAQASFFVWFEDHKEAVAIGPTFPRGVESNERISLERVVRKLA